MRKVFDAWREHTVRKATGHTGRKWQNNESGQHVGRGALSLIDLPHHYCPPCMSVMMA